MAAGVQAADIGGFLKQCATVCRAGADNGTDAPLRDDPRGPRAGGRIGEQKLYILGPCRPGIDEIAASPAAFDLAGDLQLVLVVELAWRAAVAVVELQRDLGKIARRALFGAGKDHIVHFRAAHLAGVAFAHHPAQTLDNIGFAAAIRADNAGHARFDLDLCRVGKGLETGHLQGFENH